MCHDPFVEKQANLKLVSLEEALQWAHCAVLLVDHKPFKTANWEALSKVMAQPVIVDTRGIISLHHTNDMLKVLLVS